MNPHAGRRQRGLSLLEILVALTILAFGLTALYRASAQSVANLGHIEKRAYAVSMAESLLARYQSVPPSGIHVTGGGGAEAFAWQLKSEPHAVTLRFQGFEPADNLQLWTFHRVHARVTWTDRRREYAFDLVTLLPESDHAGVSR